MENPELQERIKNDMGQRKLESGESGRMSSGTIARVIEEHNRWQKEYREKLEQIRLRKVQQQKEFKLHSRHDAE